MDIWILYLLIGFLLGLVAISYKAEKPVLNFFSMFICLILAASFIITDFQTPSGQNILSNQTSENVTMYNVTSVHIDLDANTGVPNVYYSLLFLVMAIYFLFDCIVRIRRQATERSRIEQQKEYN
jgi:hypothetical protein